MYNGSPANLNISIVVARRFLKVKNKIVFGPFGTWLREVANKNSFTGIGAKLVVCDGIFKVGK